MALQWQRISWRPLSGLDQYRDELLLAPNKATVMDNTVIKGGVARTRRGFTTFSTLPTDNTAKSMFSANGELCVVGDKRLFAWSPANDSFLERGKVPVGSGKLEVIHEGETSSVSSDSCVTTDQNGNKYTVQVYGTAGLVTVNENVYTRIGIRVLGEDGETVYQDDNFDSAVTELSSVYGPRCIVTETSGIVVIGYAEGYDTATPGTDSIHFYTWNPNLPSTAPVLQESVNDMYIEEALDGAPFDMVPTGGDTYAFAYVFQTGAFQYARVRARSYVNGAILNPYATSTRDTTTSGVRHCAISYDSTRDYVCLATARTVGGNSFLEYNAYTLADTLPGVAPVILLDTLTGITSLHSVAISNNGSVESTSSYPDEYVAVAVSYSSPNEEPDTDYVFLSSSAASFGGTVHTLYNTTLQSQPYWKNNRCYVALQSHQEVAGYAMPFVVDTGIGDDEVNGALPFAMVAAWDFGAGPSTDIVRSVGGTVLTSGYKLSAPPKPTQDGDLVTFPACSIGTLELDKARYEQNLITLDYGFRPQAVPSVRGSVALTGSVVAWYDGQRVTELGVAGTPNAAGANPATLNGSSGSISAQAAQYTHLWRTADARGVVHRGAPAKDLDVTITDGTPGPGRSSIDIDVVRHSCTMRDIFTSAFDDMHPVGYVTGTVAPRNENFQRYSEPGKSEGNFNAKKATVRDAVLDGEDLGGVVYTTDGVDLESAFPPGCRFGANARDRLFLVGEYRGDRVRYSDPTGVGDLTGDIFAPEFNDALTLQSPNGERFTGCTETGDRIILFTSTKVYALAGLGPAPSGANNDFSGLTELSDQYGCLHERSIVRTPLGTFFQSGQGLCLLQDDLGIQLITDVDTYFNQDRKVIDAVHDEKRKQVMFLIGDNTNATKDITSLIVVLNYVDNAWYTWSQGGEAMCLHDGEPYVLDFTGRILKYSGDEGTGFDDTNFVTKTVGTPWLRMDETNSGWGKLRSIFVTGKGDHDEEPSVTLSIYYDNEDTAAETHTLTPANAILAATDKFEWRIRPARGNCTSLRVELADVAPSAGAFSSGFSSGFDILDATYAPLELRSIDFELGRKGGTRKVRQEIKS